jgi:acetyltransferase
VPEFLHSADPLLRALLEPQSVAVIGAGERPGSVGAAVFGNLLAAGFRGPVWPVNPKHGQIAGRAAFATADQLPAPPDLAVICTPAASVPGVVGQLARIGTRAAVVLTSGLDQLGPDGQRLDASMLAAARAHGMRLLGPNCVGLRVPRIALNASFSGIPAKAGPLALIAQSGGVITAFLSWAEPRQIGLSCCVSLGNASDLTAADLIDALAADAHTGAILLYLESARDGERLVAAATRAAQAKPVFALKVGRAREGAAAAATHTGAMAGADTVWEAALRRAGVHRLTTLDELYGVATLLARQSAAVDDRIAIVTNSGGPAVLAVDALIAGGGGLAPLGEESIGALDAVLPATWSRRNPVDIIGDAGPERFTQALQVVTADPAVPTTLVIHVPTDMAASADVRHACVAQAVQSGHRIIGCWMGEPQATTAADPMPAFGTPEQAVAAITHVAAAQRLRADAVLPLHPVPAPGADIASLRAQLRAEAAAGKTYASAALIELLLQAFGIPFAAVRMVESVEALGAAGAQLGYPVVLKILSPDISHKSDVGGVVTGIADGAALQAAALQMLARVAQLRPEARVQGFSLQPHVAFAHTRELIVGITRDAEFGPVLLFGHGGTAVHVIDDSAIGLPPLDAHWARELIGRTRVSRQLAAWRDWPAVDMPALEHVLCAVARMALALPELRELDINPLLAHPGGVIALDLRAGLTS